MPPMSIIATAKQIEMSSSLSLSTSWQCYMSLKRYASKYARGQYKTLLDSDVATLSGFVGGGGRVVDATALSPADADVKMGMLNMDWLRQVQGDSRLALFPRTTDEVSEILKYCTKERIAVVPQGGNTGLVYGSVPVHDEIVVSTTKMNQTLEIHPETYTATCDAGVILQTFQEAARANKLIAPLDMGSKGSCTTGGNIATNAGGIHFARYGSVRSNVLGLEAVSATGDVISTMRRDAGNGKFTNVRAVRKDNVGYDLKQLFIGTEGTLGIVTKAEWKLYDAPETCGVFMVHVPAFADVLALYKYAKRTMGDSISAFEVMDSTGLQASYFHSHVKGCATAIGEKFPLTGVNDKPSATPSFVVLIEVQGGSAEGTTAIESGPAVVFSEGLATASSSSETPAHGFTVIDSTVSLSERALKDMWTIREDLPVKLGAIGDCLPYDVCFPLDKFYASVDFARATVVEELGVKQGKNAAKIEQMLREELIVTGYGHFGDGNVHLNIVDITPDHRYKDYLHNSLSSRIYKHCVQAGGSVSAEHGIGLLKNSYVESSRSPQWYAMMLAIKKGLDPAGIMNPYKMFA